MKTKEQRKDEVWKEYNRIEDTAWKEYEKKCAEIDAEPDEIEKEIQVNGHIYVLKEQEGK